MEHRKRIIPIVLVLVLIIGGYYAYSNGALPFSPANAEVNTVSGFIEGEEVAIAAEVGGRIQSIAVDEGDRVQAGQEIVALDHSLLDAQIVQARASVDTARAQLTQIKNGPRPSDVTAAKAALASAQQNYDKVSG